MVLTFFSMCMCNVVSLSTSAMLTLHKFSVRLERMRSRHLLPWISADAKFRARKSRSLEPQWLSDEIWREWWQSVVASDFLSLHYFPYRPYASGCSGDDWFSIKVIFNTFVLKLIYKMPCSSYWCCSISSNGNTMKFLLLLLYVLLK